MDNFSLLILPGDGIGPEVMDQVIRIRFGAGDERARICAAGTVSGIRAATSRLVVRVWARLTHAPGHHAIAVFIDFIE